MSTKERSKYPLVYVPNDIKVTKNTNLLYPKKPIRPQVPKPPVIETEEEGCLASMSGLLFFPMFIGFMTTFGDGGGPAFLVFIGSLVLYLIIRPTDEVSRRNEERKKEYKKQLETFNIYGLVEYNKELKNYNEKIKLLEDEDFRKELANKKIRQALIKCPKPILAAENNKLGVSENKFHKSLVNKFGSKILRNHSINTDSTPYMPDFVYYDKITGLCIDIEIDEPYEGRTDHPIHYIGADTSRNRYFLSNNWMVIRFAEEQIVRNPLGCINWIIYSINYYLDSNIQEVEAEELEEVYCWTKEEAEMMAFRLYRNNYIPLSEIEDIFKDKTILRNNVDEDLDDLPF